MEIVVTPPQIVSQLESFDPNFCGDTYQLSANNTKIKKLKQGRTSVYLKKVVNKGIHKWRFKISTMQNTILIGVWKVKYTKSTSQDIYYNKAQGKYYGWNVHGATTTSGDQKYNKYYGNRAKTGDTIEMILDLDKSELKYNVNGKSQGIIFEDQNIEKCSYVVGILIEKMLDSLQLLSYVGSGAATDQDDIKCSECDKLKAQNKSMEQQIETTIRQSAQKVDELQSELSLKTAIVNSLKQEVQQMKTLKQKNEEKNNEKDYEIQELKREIKVHEEYKTEMDRKYQQVNEANIKLNEECKEYQLNLQEITRKYNKLLRKSKINEDDYENWSADLICDWIVGLDKDYEKYEEKLRTNMKEEGMVGSILSELERNDLHRFGVTQIMHKIAIMKHIKRITSGQLQAQQQQIAISQRNEGNNAAPTAYI